MMSCHSPQVHFRWSTYWPRESSGPSGRWGRRLSRPGRSSLSAMSPCVYVLSAKYRDNCPFRDIISLLVEDIASVLILTLGFNGCLCGCGFFLWHCPTDISPIMKRMWQKRRQKKRKKRAWNFNSANKDTTYYWHHPGPILLFPLMRSAPLNARKHAHSGEVTLIDAFQKQQIKAWTDISGDLWPVQEWGANWPEHTRYSAMDSRLESCLACLACWVVSSLSSWTCRMPVCGISG